MTTQENATLARMAYDLYNDHQSDPAWLDKSLAAVSEDCEISLVPLGITLRGQPSQSTPAAQDVTASGFRHGQRSNHQHTTERRHRADGEDAPPLRHQWP